MLPALATPHEGATSDAFIAQSLEEPGVDTALPGTHGLGAVLASVARLGCANAHVKSGEEAWSYRRSKNIGRAQTRGGIKQA